jgi:hypothetical protein
MSIFSGGGNQMKFESFSEGSGRSDRISGWNDCRIAGFACASKASCLAAVILRAATAKPDHAV